MNDRCREAFHDLASEVAPVEANGAFPNDEDDATVGTVDFVATSRGIDDESASGVTAACVDLCAVKNVDVLITLMPMVGDAGARRVAQERGRRPAVAVSIKTMNLDTRPKGAPREVRGKGAFRKLRQNNRFTLHAWGDSFIVTSLIVGEMFPGSFNGRNLS